MYTTVDKKIYTKINNNSPKYIKVSYLSKFIITREEPSHRGCFVELDLST